jgi:hypothetical protein
LSEGLRCQKVVAAEEITPGIYGLLGKVEAVCAAGAPLGVGPGEGHCCPAGAGPRLVDTADSAAVSRAVLVSVGDIGCQLEAGDVPDMATHLVPRRPGHSRIFFDVLFEVVAADEEGEAVGAELGDVHALAAGIPAAEDAEVVLHLRPHLLPGSGGAGELGMKLLDFVDCGTIVGRGQVAIYRAAARARKVRLTGRDDLSA